MEHSRLTQNRKSQRSNLLMAATLEAGGPSIAVKLRNLSSDGALVEGAGLPDVGAPVVFRKNDLTMFGRVVWHDGTKAGIAFDGELSPDMVLRHVPSPKPQAKLDFRRPGLRGQLSAGERKVAEDWIFGTPHPQLGE